jgi:hypothetical protein
MLTRKKEREKERNVLTKRMRTGWTSQGQVDCAKCGNGVREFIEECDGGISLFHFIPFQSIS